MASFGRAPAPVFGSTRKVNALDAQGYRVAGASGMHTVDPEEEAAYLEWFNKSFQDDADIGSFVPLAPDQLFTLLVEPYVWCKLLNRASPGAFTAEQVRSMKGQTRRIQQVNNLNAIIEKARAIGCQLVNISGADIADGSKTLILSMLWQVLERGLLSSISLNRQPELRKLLERGETIEDLQHLPPYDLLLRWVNYHLANSDTSRRITNFGSDIKDSEVYTHLLYQVGRFDGCDMSPLQNRNLVDRAAAVLVQADKIGCRRFVKKETIVAGNERLNLAFVATIFNERNGLNLPLGQCTFEPKAIQLTAPEGGYATASFKIWNQGRGPMLWAADHPHWVRTAEPRQGYLECGAWQTVHLTAHCTTAGDVRGALEITGGEAPAPLPVSVRVVPGVLEIEPAELVFEVPELGQCRRQLSIRNAGAGAMTWRLEMGPADPRDRAPTGARTQYLEATSGGARAPRQPEGFGTRRASVVVSGGGYRREIPCTISSLQGVLRVDPPQLLFE
eukprot:tig00000157_g9690.t1